MSLLTELKRKLKYSKIGQYYCDHNYILIRKNKLNGKRTWECTNCKKHISDKTVGK